MSDPAQAKPDFWGTVETVFDLLTSGVASVFYDGVDENGSHKIGIVVYDLGSMTTAAEAGCALDDLKTQHGFNVVLGEIREAVKTSSPELGPHCPTCGITWSFCRQPELHKYDTRQQAHRNF